MAEKGGSGDEIEWAREYERSLLRPWARFPRNGEVFEAQSEMQIDYLTHWAAPFTGGGKYLLRKGTRIRVSVMPFDPEPIGVYAAPLDAALEKEIVPEAERTGPKYGGFSLFVKTDRLNREFRQIT